MSVLEKVVNDLKERLARYEKIEQEIMRFFDEEWGEVGSLENAIMELQAGYSKAKHLVGIEEELRAYKEMFPCAACGKPLSWMPDDNLGQALKAFVRERRWSHSSCINWCRK